MRVLVMVYDFVSVNVNFVLLSFKNARILSCLPLRMAEFCPTFDKKFALDESQLKIFTTSFALRKVIFIFVVHPFSSKMGMPFKNGFSQFSRKILSFSKKILKYVLRGKYSANTREKMIEISKF